MKKYDGFTLIELLVTLSLFAILSAFVLGFKQHFFVKNKIDNLVSQITNALLYSRNMAMTSGQDVSLNADGASGDWSDGMLLFVDNAKHHYTRADKLIYTWQWPHIPQVQLVWRGFKAEDYLTFSKILRRSTVNGHFAILYNNVEVRRIVVNRLGRVKSMSLNS